MPETTLSDVEFERLPTPLEAAGVADLYDKRVSAFLGLPVLIDDNRVVTTVDWADGTLSIAAQPDVPRNVTCVLTDTDNSVTGLLTILGLDYAGRAITETMQPIGDGNGKTLVGTKIFAEITSCIITSTAGAAGGTDKLIIGVGNVIGVPWDLLHTGAVAFAYLGGVKLTPDAIAIGAGTSGVDVNSGTMDGAKWLHAIIQPARSTA